MLPFITPFYDIYIYIILIFNIITQILFILHRLYFYTCIYDILLKLFILKTPTFLDVFRVLISTALLKTILNELYSNIFRVSTFNVFGLEICFGFKLNFQTFFTTIKIYYLKFSIPVRNIPRVFTELAQNYERFFKKTFRKQS